jgi:hypothetical protein
VNDDERACPYCAETIKRAAKICRFCQRDVEPVPPAAAAQSNPAARASAPVAPQRPRLTPAEQKRKDRQFLLLLGGIATVVGVLGMAGALDEQPGNANGPANSTAPAKSVAAADPPAKAEPSAREKEEAENRRQGFHCLSAWDGSHRELARAVKDMLRDPDSFAHAETRIAPANSAGTHRLIMTYRARNGFGGMNVARAIADVDTNTCEATLISAGE